MSRYHQCLLALRCLAALLAAIAATGLAAAGDDGPGPLILQRQGSFFVGGQTESTGPNSDITIDQMYVQFQVPEGAGTHLPVVMLHGCRLKQVASRAPGGP